MIAARVSTTTNTPRFFHQVKNPAFPQAKSFYIHTKNSDNITSVCVIELPCTFSQALAWDWDVAAKCK